MRHNSFFGKVLKVLKASYVSVFLILTEKLFHNIAQKLKISFLYFSHVGRCVLKITASCLRVYIFLISLIYLHLIFAFSYNFAQCNNM